MDERPHVFVSDVHLSPGAAARSERFLAFLDSLVGRIAGLYVLGDLFHYWLGRGHERLPDYAEIFAGFRAVAEGGASIDLVWGNRDFLVSGPAFAEVSGIAVRGDEHAFVAGGRRVKVVHGDLLCTDDVAYQRFRKFIRSRPVGFLSRVLPLAARRGAAGALRAMSQREVQRKSEYVMDLGEEAVRALFADGTELAVCGHIHREQHRRVALDGREADLMVLGSWDREAPFMVLEAGGAWRFCRDAL